MNPVVMYEINHYVFEQKIIFMISTVEHFQNRNFLKQWTVIQNVTRNLNRIMYPKTKLKRRNCLFIFQKDFPCSSEIR